MESPIYVKSGRVDQLKLLDEGVLFEIASFLTLPDITRLAQTCSANYRVLLSDLLWKPRTGLSFSSFISAVRSIHEIDNKSTKIIHQSSWIANTANKHRGVLNKLWECVFIKLWKSSCFIFLLELGLVACKVDNFIEQPQWKLLFIGFYLIALSWIVYTMVALYALGYIVNLRLKYNSHHQQVVDECTKIQSNTMLLANHVLPSLKDEAKEQKKCLNKLIYREVRLNTSRVYSRSLNSANTFIPDSTEFAPASILNSEENQNENVEEKDSLIIGSVPDRPIFENDVDSDMELNEEKSERFFLENSEYNRLGQGVLWSFSEDSSEDDGVPNTVSDTSNQLDHAIDVAQSVSVAETHSALQSSQDPKLARNQPWNKKLGCYEDDMLCYLVIEKIDSPFSQDHLPIQSLRTRDPAFFATKPYWPKAFTISFAAFWVCFAIFAYLLALILDDSVGAPKSVTRASIPIVGYFLFAPSIMLLCDYLTGYLSWTAFIIAQISFTVVSLIILLPVLKIDGENGPIPSLHSVSWFVVLLPVLVCFVLCIIFVRIMRTKYIARIQARNQGLIAINGNWHQRPVLSKTLQIITSALSFSCTIFFYLAVSYKLHGSTWLSWTIIYIITVIGAIGIHSFDDVAIRLLM